jgi:hypothetical protein
LCRLWNITRDNTSCLKAENRRKTPSLQEFLEPVIGEMDPEEAVEEMYKVPCANQSWGYEDYCIGRSG